MKLLESRWESEPTRRRMFIAIMCGGAIGGVAILTLIQAAMRARATARVVRVAQLRAKSHLDNADAESLAGIDEQLATLDTFFEDAKENARGFAEDMLGVISKYRMATGGHRSFVERRFESRFFSPEQLKQALTNVVTGYAAELEAVDNRMLVNVRADIADLPECTALAEISAPDLRERYRSVCGRVVGITSADAAVDVGRIAADTVVSGAVAMVAARMGTSAAVVGSGAASGAMTLGVGAVIGVIVDQIIAKAWSWAYDPKGKLVRMMKAKIDELRNLIVEGDSDKPGLRVELQRLADQHAAIRRSALMQVLAGTMESR